MGSSQSIVDNQAFYIITRPQIVRNSSKSPHITKDVRGCVYQYLNSYVFQQQVQADLNAYFEKTRVIKVMIHSVTATDSRFVKIRGRILVLKPGLLNNGDYSIAKVRSALHRLIPAASQAVKYPRKGYGVALGPNKEHIGLRFYKLATITKMVAQK
jgi:hypothetical protein